MKLENKWDITLAQGDTLIQPIKIKTNFDMTSDDEVLIVVRDKSRKVIFNTRVKVELESPRVAYVSLIWDVEETEKHDISYNLWDATYYQYKKESDESIVVKKKILFRNAKFNIVEKQSSEDGVAI